MNPDMLLLAERLVLAIERMSQDVNNISAYVYDISYNVSRFLEGKQEKDDISENEVVNLPSGAPAAGQEACTKSDYSSQYEQHCASLASHVDNLGPEKSSVGNVASMSNSDAPDVLSCVPEEIMSQEETKCEGSVDSCDVSNTCAYGRTIENISKEESSQTQFESDEEDHFYGGHTSASTSHEPLSGCTTYMSEPPESNLMDHMGVLSGQRPYECHICKRSFVAGSHLEVHMRLHRGERPFKCTECGKAFTQKGNLTVHMRTHSGEKPYKCSECGKAFSYSNTLTSHMRVHTGQKPFKCPVCGKGFSQSCNLNIHMRAH